MDSRGYPSHLEAHLHELAEGLQAASYSLKILQSAGDRAVDVALVEKTDVQLRRAQDSFRARLGDL